MEAHFVLNILRAIQSKLEKWILVILLMLFIIFDDLSTRFLLAFALSLNDKNGGIRTAPGNLFYVMKVTLLTEILNPLSLESYH